MRPAAHAHAPAASKREERSPTEFWRVVDESRVSERGASNAARHAASAARVEARVRANARKTASTAFASSGRGPRSFVGSREKSCPRGCGRCAQAGTPASSRGPARGARSAAREAAPAFAPRRAACFRFRPRLEPPAKAKLDGVEIACMVGSYPAQPHAVILSRLRGPRAARPTPDAIRVRRARLEHLAVSAVPSTGVRRRAGRLCGSPLQMVRVRWHTAPVRPCSQTSQERSRRFAVSRGDFIPPRIPSIPSTEQLRYLVETVARFFSRRKHSKVRAEDPARPLSPAQSTRV